MRVPVAPPPHQAWGQGSLRWAGIHTLGYTEDKLKEIDRIWSQICSSLLQFPSVHGPPTNFSVDKILTEFRYSSLLRESQQLLVLEVLPHTITLCLNLKNCQIVLQSGCTISYSRQQ